MSTLRPVAAPRAQSTHPQIMASAPAASPAPADAFVPTPAPGQNPGYGPGLVPSRPSADALESRAVAAFSRLVDSPELCEDPWGLWRGILQDTTEWLSRPESYGKNLQGVLFSANAPGADVRIVHLQAPFPQLAGTMDRVWSFVQWRDPDGEVHLQPLHENSPTSFGEVCLLNEGGRQVLVGVGRAVVSSHDGVLEVTVRELRDGNWQEPPAPAFVSNTPDLEGHEIFLSPDGGFGIENDYRAEVPIRAWFDGNSGDIVLKGRERQVLRRTGGHYELKVRTREEILAEERGRQARELRGTLAPHSDGIKTEPDQVHIGSVTLPVRIRG